MKYSYTLILFVFALSFLSAQEPQEQKIETLLNNRILEKIDLNQELLTFDLKNFWKDSLVIDSSSNNPGLTELINYVELRRLLKENSQNDFLQFTTDVYEINNKNYKAALINFDAAIKLVPDFFIYHFWKLAVDSVFSEAYNGLGLSHAGIKNYPTATAYLQKAIKLNERFAKAHYNLGKIYLNLEQYNDAIQSLNHSTTAEPHFPSAYFYRGLAKEELGQIAEAERDIAEALKQNKYYPEAKKKLEKLHKMLDKK